MTTTNHDNDNEEARDSDILWLLLNFPGIIITIFILGSKDPDG